jgi:hypothetical protein
MTDSTDPKGCPAMIALRGGFDPAMRNSNPISTEIKKIGGSARAFHQGRAPRLSAFPSDEVWRNYVEDALSSRYRNRELE